MEQIRFIGLNKCDDLENTKIRDLTKKHLTKLGKYIEDYTLIMKIRKHAIVKKSIDKSVKYSIHIKIEFPNILINASYADWDLTRTVHRVFEKVEHEIEHKFRTQKKSWVKKRYKNA